jgi:hypothetical protein
MKKREGKTQEKTRYKTREDKIQDKRREDKTKRDDKTLLTFSCCPAKRVKNKTSKTRQGSRNTRHHWAAVRRESPLVWV